MVMLQAFIDDSASESGDKRLFLAGYVNTAERWALFSDAWDRELRSHPAINHFHMVEAWNLSGEFRGWSEEERNKKLLKLAALVGAYRPWSIECSVSRDEYWNIIRPVAPYGLGNPYLACFQGVIFSLARLHHSMGASVPVDFIFDEQGALGADAVLFWEHMKTIPLPDGAVVLGSTPIFRDDKKILPLQAADFLAWHVRREREKRPNDPALAALPYLRISGAHLMVEIDKASLEHMAAGMKLVPGVEHTQTKQHWKKIRASIAANPLGFMAIPRESLFARLKRFLGSLFRGRL
jgi:hypothetical protein